MVVAVALVVLPGWRMAALVAGLSAGVWFDFFLTRPYERFTIQRSTDIQTTVLLAVVGVLIGEIAVRRRQARTDHRTAHDEVLSLHVIAEMLANGSAAEQVVTLVQTVKNCCSWSTADSTRPSTTANFLCSTGAANCKTARCAGPSAASASPTATSCCPSNPRAAGSAPTSSAAPPPQSRSPRTAGWQPSRCRTWPAPPSTVRPPTHTTVGSPFLPLGILSLVRAGAIALLAKDPRPPASGRFVAGQASRAPRRGLPHHLHHRRRRSPDRRGHPRSRAREYDRSPIVR